MGVAAVRLEPAAGRDVGVSAPLSMDCAAEKLRRRCMPAQATQPGSRLVAAGRPSLVRFEFETNFVIGFPI